MEVIPKDRLNGWRRLVPWLGLACIVATFLLVLIRLHPTNFFGYTRNDSIYFSSAKGLAEGKGYALPSFPGVPAATKYPIFYPWLLSWVWRWNPSFPSNLVDAILINGAFGVALIIMVFLFLRRLKTLDEVEVLILTAFCALHPVLLFYSGNLLSEIPFAAMALGAMLLAEKISKGSKIATTITCGVLVGLCILTRVLGVPVAAGIGFALLSYRARRQLLLFSGTVAPFFAALFWQTISAHQAHPPVSGIGASSPMWIHTWTYYTSYVNVWKEGVPTVATFLLMMKGNIAVLLLSPATYLLSPMIQVSTIRGAALMAVVAALTLAGVFRESRKNGFRPVHFVLPFYACVILLWSYPDANRFLIPFLPLFAAGIWIEGKHVLKMVRAAISSGATAEKLFAVAIGSVVFIVIGAVTTNYVGPARDYLTSLTAQRATLLPEKQEAYNWISRFAASDARIVAYEDASLYLYARREAVRPFTFTAAEFYNPGLLDKDLDHITDVPDVIGAQYWVFSDDDLGYEWHDAYIKGRARMRVIENVFPLVFRSSNDHVHVYSLGCLQAPKPSLTAGYGTLPKQRDCGSLSARSGNHAAASD